jgi:hypothetical protein
MAEEFTIVKKKLEASQSSKCVYKRDWEDREDELVLRTLKVHYK